jgi:hypothetical protein
VEPKSSDSNHRALPYIAIRAIPQTTSRGTKRVETTVVVLGTVQWDIMQITCPINTTRANVKIVCEFFFLAWLDSSFQLLVNNFLFSFFLCLLKRGADIPQHPYLRKRNYSKPLLAFRT